MKHALAIAILAATATAAVAADDTYKVSDTESFSTRNVYKIEPFTAGYAFVKVSYINGGDNLYRDNTGDLLARIVENQPELTQITGTAAYVNPLYAARTSCSNGKSTVAMQGSGITVQVTDACALSRALADKAK